MNDNYVRFGCSGAIAFVVLVALLWVAILYVGIPLAFIGFVIAFVIFNRRDPDIIFVDNDHEKKAALIAGGSLLLAAVSIFGNVYTDAGPFKSETEAEAFAQTESKAPKIEVSAAECSALKSQTESALYMSCATMNDSGSWTASVDRNICIGNYNEKLRACGVDAMDLYDVYQSF